VLLFVLHLLTDDLRLGFHDFLSEVLPEHLMFKFLCCVQRLSLYNRFRVIVDEVTGLVLSKLLRVVLNVVSLSDERVEHSESLGRS
jgi:hypothetical protein